MTAEHISSDQEGGLAAVGESILYDVQSTNTGNVDVAQVTMSAFHSAGRWRERRYTFNYKQAHDSAAPIVCGVMYSSRSQQIGAKYSRSRPGVRAETESLLVLSSARGNPFTN